MINETAGVALGRKVALVLVGLGLFVILAEAFVYRLEHPSLTVRPAVKSMPGAGGGMPPEAMGEITGLMQRLSENPNDISTLLELSERFMTAGDWGRTRVFADRALVAEPANPKALFMAGIARASLGDHAEAASRLEMLVSLESDHVLARYNLGLLYSKFLGRPDKAAGHFKAVLESDRAGADLKDRARHELEAHTGE